MRVGAVLVACLAACLVAAGIVSAQGTPPVVTVTTSQTAATLQPPGPLAPGQTRFDIVRSGRGDREVIIGYLRAGVTLEQFTAALRANPDSAIELSHLEGGTSLTAREERRSVTIDLQPNAQYVALNIAAENPRDWGVTPFTTTGQPNGAPRPSADATIRMADLRFTGDRVLPRNGNVRVRNQGWAPHFALAAPLRRGATSARLGRALRSGNDRALGRVLDFRQTLEVQSLITRGADTVAQVRFPRAGRYALICFFEGHAEQGMYRIVRVR